MERIDETDLRELITVLHARRSTVLVVTGGVLALALVFVLTRTPIYEARLRLLIEIDSPNVVQFQEVVENDPSFRSDNYHETQIQLLYSRSLAHRTLEEVDPWPGAAAADPERDRGAQSRRVDAFLESFSATPVGTSRLVDIRFRAPDPTRAAAVLDAHARGFVRQNMEFRFEASRDATQWLGERLAEQRRSLEDSEAALQRYREQNEAVVLDDADSLVALRLEELNAAQVAARTDLIAKEADYYQLEAARRNPSAIDALPVVAANPYIQQLRADLAALVGQRAQLAENLGERHPDMIAVVSAVEAAETHLREEIETVVQAVRNDFRAARTRVESLERELERQQAHMLAAQQLGIRYAVLAREVDTNRQMYDSLLQRAKETGVSSELRTGNVHIVDAAEVPTTPVSPRAVLTLGLALVLGATGGVGLAWLQHLLDRRIKLPEELTDALGVPCLATIPATDAAGLEATSLLITDGAPPDFVEAIRRLRTGVMFSTAEGHRTILVTSSRPGEGKSAIIANLAASLAQAEQRVLVVDGDLRSPVLHERYACAPSPGLTDLLQDRANTKEAIRDTGVPGLWLLPSGSASPNPAELLGSETFRALLDTLPAHFDWVLIDSPPVMAVTDAAVVAHAASGVVFVVAADQITRRTATRALEELRAANGTIVGGVLNRFDLAANADYDLPYGYDRYRQYAPVAPVRD